MFSLFAGPGMSAFSFFDETGPEMNVRHPVDEKAAGEFGGWADTALMRRTYTHAEDSGTKIHAVFRVGLDEAEAATGPTLKRMVK